jgi:hypothetical protein
MIESRHEEQLDADSVARADLDGVHPLPICSLASVPPR